MPESSIIASTGPASLTNAGAENITVTITPKGSNDLCDASICEWWTMDWEITTSSTHVYEEEEPPGSGTMVPYTAVAIVTLAQNWWSSSLGTDNSQCIPPYSDIIRCQDIIKGPQQRDTQLNQRWLKKQHFPNAEAKVSYVLRRTQRLTSDASVLEEFTEVIEDNGCEFVTPPSPAGGSVYSSYLSGPEGGGTWAENEPARWPFESLPLDAEITSIIEDFAESGGEAKICNCDLHVFGKAEWPTPPPGHVNHPVGFVQLGIYQPCCARGNYDTLVAAVNKYQGDYNTPERKAAQENAVVALFTEDGNIFVDLNTGEEINPSDLPENVIKLGPQELEEEQFINLPPAGGPGDETTEEVPVLLGTPFACLKIKNGYQNLGKEFNCKIGNSTVADNPSPNSPIQQVNCKPVRKTETTGDGRPFKCFDVKKGFEKSCEIVEGNCDTVPQESIPIPERLCFKIENGYHKTCATGECS